MIKAFLTSLLLLILFAFAHFTDVFAMLSHRVTLYIASGILITVFAITTIVLKAYADEEARNEEDNK